MARILTCLVLGACCAPLWAFDLPERERVTPALFDPGPFLNAQDEETADDEAPEEDEYATGGREIDGWFGRGFGISVSATFLIGLDAGIGVSMPVHELISVTAAAHATSGFEFTGVYYDLGVRGYMDEGDGGVLALYGETGVRLSNGQVSDFFRADDEGGLDLVASGLALGGYVSVGIELGSPRIRFFSELSVGFSQMLEPPREPLVLVRLHVGLRIYLGTSG